MSHNTINNNYQLQLEQNLPTPISEYTQPQSIPGNSVPVPENPKSQFFTPDPTSNNGKCESKS